MHSDLEAVLYGFLQAVFTGTPAPDVEPDFEDALARLAEHRTLRAERAMQWPANSRVALKNLIADWIISIRLACEFGDGYDFPETWLVGCSSTRLNEQVLSEILDRSSELRAQYQRRQRGE